MGGDGRISGVNVPQVGVMRRKVLSVTTSCCCCRTKKNAAATGFPLKMIGGGRFAAHSCCKVLQDAEDRSGGIMRILHPC